MDWRSGSKQTTTGSAFRGMNTRGRPRARGRGVPPNCRGAHGVNADIPPSPSAPPVAPQAKVTTSPSRHPQSKSPSLEKQQQSPRRVPLLNRIDMTKATVAPATPVTPGPQANHRTSRSPIDLLAPTPTHPNPDLSTPNGPDTPAGSRPRVPRKRSHNRTRSSSKPSTTQPKLSAESSISSFKERKEIPPHMALASAPPDVQSFDHRNDIDTLVERVRAMAMAGSSIDKGKDKECKYTPSDGHIDWAGDEDDTLPDLDDWVKPKPTLSPPKGMESTRLDLSPTKPPLSSVKEVAGPIITTKENKNSMHTMKPTDSEQEMNHVMDGDQADKSPSEVSKDAVIPVKPKARGRYSKRKSSVSDASVPSSGTRSSAVAATNHSEPSRSHLPLVHPLPAKPEVSITSARGMRPRGPPHAVKSVTETINHVSDPAPLQVLSCENMTQQPSPQKAETAVTTPESTTIAIDPEPQAKKRTFDPSVDWANAPRLKQSPPEQNTHPASEAISTDVGDQPEARAKECASDSSVDWSKAPRIQGVSPSRRSPSRSPPSPSGHLSVQPVHPQDTIPSQHRARGPFMSHNSSPRLSPSRADALRAPHSRSQLNSPERNPHHKVIQTHLRAHSSPQTGPGTRSHSRPVITLDALSRLSRTLGVTGTTTPPRRQPLEVAVTD